jgi:ribosomal protein S12 methylthiotransferase accessory factor
MAGPAGSQAAQFLAAADALSAAPASSNRAPMDGGLLDYLNYRKANAALNDQRGRMLRAAAKLRRMFLLPVPDAPGLVFFGGEADPTVLGASHAGQPVGSLAGSGLSPQRAFESCVGEGIEYLSQFIQDADPIEIGPALDRGTQDPQLDAFVSAVLTACDVDQRSPIAFVPARRLSDQAQAWFPADLCYRRHVSEQDFAAPLKLSTGCAAGATFEMAALRAVLELIERDAMSLWWRGGRRARPIAGDSEAGRGAAELLVQLRQGQHERQCWLLDITTDIGIPAVAAISANQDGYGFAFGLGARLSVAEAASAAIFELCQVELGQHVVARKRRESGAAALNENDLRQLRRGTLFDTRNCTLLQPFGEPGVHTSGIPTEAAAALEYIVGRLVGLGIATYRVDLTRSEFGIPVVRVLTPGLQLEPCLITGPRLAQVISETGGGAVHTGGMPLL